MLSLVSDLVDKNIVNIFLVVLLVTTDASTLFVDVRDVGIVIYMFPSVLDLVDKKFVRSFLVGFVVTIDASTLFVDARAV